MRRPLQYPFEPSRPLSSHSMQPVLPLMSHHHLSSVLLELSNISKIFACAVSAREGAEYRIKHYRGARCMVLRLIRWASSMLVRLGRSRGKGGRRRYSLRSLRRQPKCIKGPYDIQANNEFWCVGAYTMEIKYSLSSNVFVQLERFAGRVMQLACATET